METRTQTFMKALSWESISFVLTLVVSYAVIDDAIKATMLSLFLFCAKVILLFVYERTFRRMRKWLRPKGGKSR